MTIRFSTSKDSPCGTYFVGLQDDTIINNRAGKRKSLRILIFLFDVKYSKICKEKVKGKYINNNNLYFEIKKP